VDLHIVESYGVQLGNCERFPVAAQRGAGVAVRL
jgi:hypothetical protein